MKKVLIIMTSMFFLATMACKKENNTTVVDNIETEIPNRKIQLAILLDTSSSMDGLIEQAKNQLWKIVNQLAKAKCGPEGDPEIELALYQYGNDDLSLFSGYIEQVSGFTTELDEISEKLFGLTTNGGSEYCGAVIKSSLMDLNWSDSPLDLKLIFIAGNESFDQGNISYKTICKQANQKSISVNTIFCGNYQEGINSLWSDGAQIGNGKYLNIDQDATIVHIASPYDDEIQRLNSQLNETYIPYGKMGKSKKEKQLKADADADSYGQANAVKRSISKSTKVYKNKSWDLVDAAEEEDFEIEAIDSEALPEEMQIMDTEEKKAYIVEKQEEREKIKADIKKLSTKRSKYVAAERQKSVNDSTQQLDNAIIEAIVVQAKGKSFTFEEEE